MQQRERLHNNRTTTNVITSNNRVMKVKIELEPSKSPFRLFYFASKIGDRVELLGDISNGPDNGYEVYLQFLTGERAFKYAATLLEATKIIEKETLFLYNIRTESNVER